MNNNDSFWLINSKGTEVKRFLKNKKNDDRFFEYMFVDSGDIIGLLGDNPPLLKKRVSLKINEARVIYKRLLSEGWRETKPVW